MMRFIVSTLAVLATAVHGQKTVSWTEATSGVVYSMAIPAVDAAPFEVYLSITAPANITWAAVAFGGCMLRSPLVVAWKNSTNVVAAPRWATEYHPPALYNGTSVVVSKTSSVNATHWTANLLVSGGSSWYGGTVKSSGSVTFGWGVSNRPLGNPASVDSSIGFHNVGKGHFEVDITAARNSPSDFESIKSKW
ncbi:iron reductase domain protein [Cadophora sp. DSE1049]|nr:iron reductase domain protein [Cadophora sp. DSE1049]